MTTESNDISRKLNLEMKLIRGGEVEHTETIRTESPQQVLRSVDGIADMARRQYPPANQCIYCGETTGLSKEHIVPYGLNGTSTIQKASCSDCAAVTGDFERRVLRGPMRSVRLLHGFQSRRKHEGASRTQMIEIEKDGKMSAIEVPIDEMPILLFFPEFTPPWCLTGKTGKGIDMTGVAVVHFGPSPEEFAKSIGADSVRSESPPMEPAAFARLIAKIGYAHAFAEGALDQLEVSNAVVPAILGQEGIGQWVGTLGGPYPKYPGVLHRVALRVHKEAHLFMAEVQLFASSAAPAYGMVLGMLKTAT